jgi:type VII secretion integral membrane protein EccD
MTTIQAEVCRVTVLAPTGRMDFAVPLSVTVAGLLPVLVRRLVDAAETDADADTRWVLQRLGGPPLDPHGTPESLGWLDGDEFHLRPADEQLPELMFDDIADGMATTIDAHRGRWRPEFNQRLFLGLSIAAFPLLAVVLLVTGTTRDSAIGSLVIAAVLLAAAIVAGVRIKDDDILVLLLGLAGCGFAGLGAAIVPAGPAAALRLAPGAVLSGGLGLAVAAAIVLVARGISGSRWPRGPFGVLVVSGVLAVVSQWLHVVMALTPVRIAGTFTVLLLVLLVLAPRLAMRVAGLRGPQLPHTAEQLQENTEPLPAGEVGERTTLADDVLTVTVVSAVIGYVCSIPYLLAGGLFGVVLAILAASTMLLRARSMVRVWQRIPLVVGGSAGVVMIALAMAIGMGAVAANIVLILCCVLVLALLAAVRRPPKRRMMPIWGRYADWAETLTTIAMVPVLLQLFGLYAWARGLAG